MSSLARRVTGTAVAALCVSLLTVGLLTAEALDLRARHSLDQALLATAFAEAHPWPEVRFENDYVRSPFALRRWSPEDPQVSEAMYRRALDGELPVFATIDGQRVLILIVEPDTVPASDRTENHPHFGVVASAPVVTFGDVALPFLTVYLAVSALVVLAAGLVTRRAMSHALAPIRHAAHELEQVRGLASTARLQLGGTEEVDQLIESANALLDRLETAFEAQTSFTAQAAHELRTPVTVLKGELELALRRPRDAAEYQATLGRLTGEIDRLAALVEGLMALTRVEAGQAEQGRTIEHVSEAARRALHQERRTLEQAGAEATLRIDGDPEVSMNVVLVSTAIGNLIRNAVLHGGSPIAVHVAGTPDRATVRVDDDGPGLDLEERRRVLERFQRGGRDGLGLGLPLAREIARRHGGDLTLSDAPGGGLRAELWLPTTQL